MLIVFLIFLTLWNSLWCSCELAELKYYQREIEDSINFWPQFCRGYTQTEMDAVPKLVALRQGDKKTAEYRARLVGFMKGMNNELKRYIKFKSMCDAGGIRSGNIKTCPEWAQFREEYFEFEEESHTPEENEDKCLEYCGIFLAKPGLISLFSGDRCPGEMYFKAITEPVYKYLKKLHEELVYYAGWIGNYHELRAEAAIKIQAVFRGYTTRKKQMIQIHKNIN